MSGSSPREAVSFIGLAFGDGSFDHTGNLEQAEARQAVEDEEGEEEEGLRLRSGGRWSTGQIEGWIGPESGTELCMVEIDEEMTETAGNEEQTGKETTNNALSPLSPTPTGLYSTGYALHAGSCNRYRSRSLRCRHCLPQGLC